MKKVLYITYDGLTDSLGQSQVLAYLKKFDPAKISVHIISYEKKENYETNKADIQRQIDASTLVWHKLKYSKNPPILSTVFDIFRGYMFALKLNKKQKFEIVHCRGYIPAFIGLWLKKTSGLKFVFDMRGWWVDEKKESGLWNGKIYDYIYSFYKKKEKDFFKYSDFAVSLTYAGKEEIIKQGLKAEGVIGVIPTCVDFDIFKSFSSETRFTIRQELSIPQNARVMIYSGALGGNYSSQELLGLFEKYRLMYPQAWLLILSKESSDSEKQIFKNTENVIFKSVSYKKVSDYLIASDIGVIFYKLSFSVIGRSPTKLGEYWACGVPVISYSGIGDLDKIIQQYPEGGILLKNSNSNYGAEIFDNTIFASPNKETLRKSAIDYFDIHKGVKFYEKVYSDLNVN